MGKIVVVGSMNMDNIVHVDHMVEVGETILSNDSITYVPGGKGANQAYTIGKLGGNVVMLGCVGNDEAGSKLIHNLQNVNVDTSHIEKKDGVSTGTAWISVDCNGNNSIVVIQGANKMVDVDYINRNIDAIESADIVIMQLEIPMETIEYCAKITKNMGKMVILDPAPATKYFPKEILKNVDILKPNNSELQILTGLRVSTEEEVKVAATSIFDVYQSYLVVSLGEDGVLVGKTKDTMKKIPANKVKAVDTTAAGDSFLAGMAMKVSDGYDIESAIAFGQKIASIVVTRPGAQSSIPSKEEVENIK